MTKPRYPSEKLDQYMLRFPDGMRETIKEVAAENKRSMNAEIIALIEEGLSNRVRSSLGIYPSVNSTGRAMTLARELLRVLQQDDKTDK